MVSLIASLRGPCRGDEDKICAMPANRKGDYESVARQALTNESNRDFARPGLKKKMLWDKNIKDNHIFACVRYGEIRHI